MNFGFATRIAFVLATILSASIVLTSVLSMHKYERTFANFLASRFEFVANDIRQRIETQMDLGLQLANLQNVNAEMETYQSGDSQILSIEVFDANGTVLFSTDTSFIGDLVTDEWIDAARSAKPDEIWSQQDARTGVVGAALYNNLDQNIGSLALRYSLKILNESVLAQASRIFAVGGGVVVAMILVGFFGAMLLLKTPRKYLRGIRGALEDLARRRADGKNLRAARTAHKEFDAFAATVIAADQAIAQGGKEIRRIDEEEAV